MCLFLPYLLTNLIIFSLLVTDKKLGFMFVPHLERFLHQNPGALWQPQQLQRKMMAKCLGTTYWERKMEQFRIIRKDLGIKLLA